MLVRAFAFGIIVVLTGIGIVGTKSEPVEVQKFTHDIRALYQESATFAHHRAPTEFRHF